MKNISDCEYRDLNNQLIKSGQQVQELQDSLVTKNFFFFMLMGFAIVVTVICFLVSFQRDSWKGRYDTIRQDAITRGFAQYNPTNGVWEWKKAQ